jgi:hypothetical protein
MGRLVVVLLALAALSLAVKYSLTSGPSARSVPAEVETGIKPVQADGEHTRPRQELDNVRERSHELEKEMQQRVDETAGKAEP